MRDHQRARQRLRRREHAQIVLVRGVQRLGDAARGDGAVEDDVDDLLRLIADELHAAEIFFLEPVLRQQQHREEMRRRRSFVAESERLSAKTFDGTDRRVLRDHEHAAQLALFRGDRQRLEFVMRLHIRSGTEECEIDFAVTQRVVLLLAILEHDHLEGVLR